MLAVEKEWGVKPFRGTKKIYFYEIRK